MDTDKSEHNSRYLDRNTFLIQSASLVDNLHQLWIHENLHHPINVSIELKNQVQYICSDG